MKVLFSFQNVLEVVTNGYAVLSEGASKAQRIAYKELQKKLQDHVSTTSKC